MQAEVNGKIQYSKDLKQGGLEISCLYIATLRMEMLSGFREFLNDVAKIYKESCK